MRWNYALNRWYSTRQAMRTLERADRHEARPCTAGTALLGVLVFAGGALYAGRAGLRLPDRRAGARVRAAPATRRFSPSSFEAAAAVPDRRQRRRAARGHRALLPAEPAQRAWKSGATGSTAAGSRPSRSTSCATSRTTSCAAGRSSSAALLRLGSLYVPDYPRRADPLGKSLQTTRSSRRKCLTNLDSPLRLPHANPGGCGRVARSAAAGLGCGP